MMARNKGSNKVMPETIPGIWGEEESIFTIMVDDCTIVKVLDSCSFIDSFTTVVFDF